MLRAGDGHLHTVHSDGRRTPAQLAAAARAAGRDFMVSTEHNTPSASLQWGEHAGADLLILNGEEVTTRSGHWPAWNLKAGRNWIAESAQVQVTFGATDGVRLAGMGEALTTGTGTPVTIELAVSGAPGTSVRLLDQSGPQWIQPVGATGSATVRWTTHARYSRWVRAEVRRPVATATTPDSMVALTNPVSSPRAEGRRWPCGRFLRVAPRCCINRPAV